MSKRKHPPLLPEDLAAHVERRAAEFRGYCPELAEAIGALVFGQVFGWKGVWMIYSRSKVKSMEAALGLTFRDVMPERTEESSRILGVRLADELGKYWAVVKGEVPVQGGKAYADDEGQSDLFMTG